MKITIETDGKTREAIGKVIHKAKKKASSTGEKIVEGCHKLNVSLYDNGEDQRSGNLSGKEEVSFAAVGTVSIIWGIFCLCAMIFIWGGGLIYAISDEQYGLAIFLFIIGAGVVIKALPNWIKSKRKKYPLKEK